MRKHARLALVVLLVLAMLMPLGAPAFAAAETDNKDFEDFLTAEWKESMESDYLTMHYNIKDYQAAGLTKPEPTLGVPDLASYADDAASLQETLDKLTAFDYESLSANQQRTYDTLKFYLEVMVELNKYPQFDEYLNPYTAGLSNIVTNFTEFVFYAEEDFDDYLKLLKSYPAYIDGMIAVTQEQSKDYGYFMPDSALDVLEEEAADFIARGDENPLIVIFNNAVDAFEGLTDARKADLKAQNAAIVKDEIFPAYQKTADAMEKLRGTRTHASLADYEGGADYYAALARYKCSTDLPLQDVYDITEYVFDMGLEAYFGNALANNAVSEEGYILAPDALPFGSPEEILEYLRAHLDDFPEGPEVSYTPSYLDPSVASPSILAYYMTPPMDDISHNVIRINGETTGDDVNGLYFTLAHEGFPGHLYQFTWFYNTQPNAIHGVMNTMGYQEGWAQYAAIQLAEKSGLDDYGVMYLILNEYMNYAYNAVIDIGVNAFGWTPEELADYTGYGLDEVGELYESLAAMPAQILPYGYGAVAFMVLRNEAEEAMGEDFDPVAFHEVLLTGGPRPFEVVTRDVEAYLTANGKAIPESADPLTEEMYACAQVYEDYVNPAVSFTDVPEDAPYKDAVDFAVAAGITNGTGDGTTFSPEAEVTRSQFATFLNRFYGEEQAEGGGYFTDVVAGSWYENAVNWAYEQGITKGTGNGLYNIDGKVTRQEIATMLYRIAQEMGLGFQGMWMYNLGETYSDVADIDEWATEAMYWMAMYGIVDGNEAGEAPAEKLDPKAACTRAETVSILMRYTHTIMGLSQEAAGEAEETVEEAAA